MSMAHKVQQIKKQLLINKFNQRYLFELGSVDLSRLFLQQGV